MDDDRLAALPEETHESPRRHAASGWRGESVTPAVWKRLILTLAVAAAVHVVFNVAGSFRNGDFGADYVEIGTSDRPAIRITKVSAPKSFSPPVHVGDVLVLYTSLAERLRLYNAGDGDRVVLYRTDGHRVVTVQQWIPPPDPLSDITTPIIQLAMIAIGGLVVLRRGERIEVRTLASFLICLASGDTRQAWPFLPDWTYLLHTYAGNVASTVALAHAVRFATLFPDPKATGVRAIIRKITPTIAVLSVGSTLYSVTSDFVFQHGSGPVYAISNNLTYAYYIAATAISFWIANVRATGADVGRVRWVSYSIGTGLAGFTAALGARAVGLSPWWENVMFSLSFLVIPMGLAYAVLRHRVIDVGFVVTRALVFATVSLLLLVSFLVVEWFLAKVLVERNHITSGAIDALLALALGVSLRSIHRRVEAVADRIFFRARHRAEAALRQFSHEVLYMTDQRTMYERTIEIVDEHADAAAAIYVFDRDARAYRRVAGTATLPKAVDADDVLFVRLRMARAAVHVHGLRSVVDADLACPIVVRGDVSGTLVCTGKRDGEAYAPDEVSTLSEVARAVGVASDGLYTETLRGELERVRAAHAALAAVVTNYKLRALD